MIDSFNVYNVGFSVDDYSSNSLYIIYHLPGRRLGELVEVMEKQKILGLLFTLSIGMITLFGFLL